MANFELAKGKRRSLVKVGVRGSRNEPNKPSKVSGSIKGLVVKRRELKKKKKKKPIRMADAFTPRLGGQAGEISALSIALFNYRA